MKTIILSLFGFISLHSVAQHSLQKIWESDTTLAIPESVLPDIKKGVLYVALIDGGPWEVDGKGGIGQLDLNGKIINANWVTGLNAPKGMGIVGNRMYVADVTQVAIINIAKGAIEKRITIDSAQALNDVTVDNKGTVFVSDSRTGKVHRIQKDKATEYLSGFKGLNGLKAYKGNLYVATGKDVYKVDAAKKQVSVGLIDQGGDGIEPVGNGDWIGSAWSGYIYYLYADGKRDLMLDTHEQKINTADIGYDPQKKIVYVPTFFKKSVVAYQLK
jgi:hypothetical protein